MNNNEHFFSDFHIHATHGRLVVTSNDDSKNKMTVKNIMDETEKSGFYAVGIMEHIEPESGRHPWSESLYVQEQVNVLKQGRKTKFFSGCEASVVDFDGNLSGSIEKLLKVNFDYIIASCHSIPKNVTVDTLEQYHKVILEMSCNLIEKSPFVDILGHPWRDSPKILKRCGINLLWDFSLIPSDDIIQVAELAAKNDVLLEISRPCFGVKGYDKFLQLAAKSGANFSLGSDAHQYESLFIWTDKEIAFLKENGIGNNNLKRW